MVRSGLLSGNSKISEYEEDGMVSVGVHLGVHRIGH